MRRTADGGALAVERLVAAHSALVSGLGWLCLAVAAAALGWRLRIVAAPGFR
ncbi:hypothetical protein Q6350_04590 [Isoptericola sp. b515]|uniref:hypothetical protein n=1 Tax=Isoptericola sp. b515 TaxID=3064652 RepID=UPI002712519A|nr:hypothetical protein [Isoptericola sp. b515]MDO8147702.1 hypothetical protein [Isoptericola sp. b515]